MSEAAERAGTSRGRAPVKSAGAFRTISEVSTELEVPQHVLRFWETKFPQVRPLKRGGGRRYYRPEDVDLLRRIQRLLYREGYTIKGVQRLLRDPQSAATAEDEAAPAGEVLADADVDAPELEEADEALAPGLSPDQRADLEAILAELEEMREYLRSALKS